MQTPFTVYDYFKISIIQDSIENVRKNLRHYLNDMSLVETELATVDFRTVCSTKSIPYNPRKIKFIVYEPLSNPGVTVFFPNFRDGWYTLVYNYTRLNQKIAFQVGFTIDESKDFSAYFFSFFFVEKGEVQERCVHAIKENKWVFYEKNKPLKIENTDNYLRKTIKERINNEIIIDYLKKAGYNLSDVGFFKSDRGVVLFSN